MGILHLIKTGVPIPLFNPPKPPPVFYKPYALLVLHPLVLELFFWKQGLLGDVFMPIMSNGMLMLDGADPNRSIEVGSSVIPFALSDFTGKPFDLKSLTGSRYLLVLLSSLANPGARDKFTRYKEAYPELSRSGYQFVVVSADSNNVLNRVINDIRGDETDGTNKIEGVTFPVIGDDTGEVINTYFRWIDDYTRRDYPVYVVDPTGRVTQIIDGDAILETDLTDLITQPSPTFAPQTAATPAIPPK